MRWLARLVIACLGDIAAMPVAQAQIYTVTDISPMSIGTVAAATNGTTVFSNATNGTVSKVSGNGNLIAGPYAYATVTIHCEDQNNFNRCSNSGTKARVYVGRTGVNTGRSATITSITVASGTGVVAGANNPSTSTVDVTVSGWTADNQDRTILVGVLWPIGGDDGGGAPGAASSQFYVYAAKNTNTPTTGMTSTVTATVRKSLQITKISDLQFGTFIRPTSGTNKVLVNSAGTRTQADAGGNVGAGTIILIPSNVSASQFTATGQAGATFSLAYPASFSMSGPGAPLTVTLTPSPANGTVTIPAGGTVSLNSGGTINVPSTQASGSYSGAYTVTITYN